ncbi:hypothetical protein NQ176_g5644 [Zarea fungicola]|uniref:Uncharacterized protein n=1 Tax=Zarea fungicola TaxID=93591 RepID=A0ACC1N807_9HYPO|nr:hypothetical protein NQ176_g5644 [Lecanicillium fungicola]
MLYVRERHMAELAVLRASILTKQVQSIVNEISKGDSSPVTIADFAAQALIIGALRAVFPNDGFLGEEDADALRTNEHLRDQVFNLVLSAQEVTGMDKSEYFSLPKPSSVYEMLDWIDLGGRGKGGDVGRFWVMDPIDGTAAFLRGQQYAVSLSLIENGREVVGVLGCPNISTATTIVSENDVDRDGFGIMLSAAKGQGALARIMTKGGLEDAIFLNHLKPPSKPGELRVVDCIDDETIQHDVVAKMALALNATYPNAQIWSAHIRYVALMLGGGDVQLWVPTKPLPSKMYIWDHAGTQLIFTELGGRVTDLKGCRVDFGAGRDLRRNDGLIVAKGDIHTKVLAAMTDILGQ